MFGHLVFTRFERCLRSRRADRVTPQRRFGQDGGELPSQILRVRELKRFQLQVLTDGERAGVEYAHVLSGVFAIVDDRLVKRACP